MAPLLSLGAAPYGAGWSCLPCNLLPALRLCPVPITIHHIPALFSSMPEPLSCRASQNPSTLHTVKMQYRRR